MSSVGSIASFVALLLFIFILWEAFVAQRPVIVSLHRGSSLEWQDLVPLSYHNLDESCVITTAVSV